jgi:GTP-binding protein Era
VNEPQGPGTATRCGFVAIVGAPNAGKSTFVNAAVGTKVSIVTHKVQTTRSRIVGIRLDGEAQIVFVDTPGIFQPKRRLERAMVEAAWTGAEEADFVLLLVDAQRGMNRDLAAILQRLEARGRPVLVAINKVDAVAKADLLPLAAAISETKVAEEVFFISALTGEGMADLLARLAARVRPGPWLYPADQVTDLPMRQLAAEIVREKLFLRLHQELPYSVAVETEMWTQVEGEDAVRIDQVIYVARDGHKPILLGKGGRTIKEIGTAARKELEEILECRVHLFLHVKVRPGWLDEPARYREMGLEFPR